MTNFERWQFYMKDFCSPQSYVDAGFYYLIGAALQRRVWTGPAHSPLYGNPYIILVGEPGIGKGLVIKQVEACLKYHTVDNPAQKPKPVLKTVEEATQYANAIENYSAATKGKKSPQEDLEKKTVLPIAPNAVTYEALVKANSSAYRYQTYHVYDEALGKTVPKGYSHSSICFCLEEISSLFRKHTQDVVNYLIQAYDCGDYEYVTKTQGQDKVIRCCLAFFGGTTPGFMRSTFDDKLLSEGFSSRTIFIFESANRHNKLFIPELSPEQSQAKLEVLAHVKKLTQLYGNAKYTPEAEQFLSHWFEFVHPTQKANNNAKLIPYYSRKGQHVQKLATAIHFGESTDMVIGLEPCMKAVEVLDRWERKMHYAVSFDNNNPLAEPARKIKNYINRSGPQTRMDLFVDFFDDVRESELNEIIEYLSHTSQLHTIKVRRKADDAVMSAYYTLPQINWEAYASSRYKKYEE